MKVVVPVTVKFPPTVALPLVVSVVNAPVEAELAPIVAPSIVPPFISVVVSTELASVTTPVESAINPLLDYL